MDDITHLINKFDNAIYACGVFRGRHENSEDYFNEENGKYNHLVSDAQKAKKNLILYIENGHT